MDATYTIHHSMSNVMSIILTCYPSRQVTLQVILYTCIVSHPEGVFQHVKELQGRVPLLMIQRWGVGV
jgi:hypothetical protein